LESFDWNCKYLKQEQFGSQEIARELLHVGRSNMAQTGTGVLKLGMARKPICKLRNDETVVVDPRSFYYLTFGLIYNLQILIFKFFSGA
jgi:hypothetical protein